MTPKTAPAPLGRKPVSIAIQRLNVKITPLERRRRNLEMLSRALNLHTTIAFLGSGCSADFGLPDWPTLAHNVATGLNEKLRISGLQGDLRAKHYKTRLNQFEKFFKAAAISHNAPGNRLQSIVNECKEIHEFIRAHAEAKPTNSTSKHTFAESVKSQLIPPSSPKPPVGIHRALFELPIHRFITSNYDLMLERELAKWVNVRQKDLVKQKAFTQQGKYSSQLAEFAMAGPGSEHMIFHCHGWENEPDSMIITEEDYQRWYLNDHSQETETFRQTLDLVFGSHPVLFVGFGMSDPDLLLALRFISAADPTRKSQRPLFAILDSPEDQDDGYVMEEMYGRYGVHVIAPKGPHGRSRGPRLKHALKEILAAWHKDREGWLAKPRIRVVPGTDPESSQYWHYRFVGTGARQKVSVRKVPLSAVSWDHSLSAALSPGDILNEIENNKSPKVIVLLGPGGSGKSWFAAQLLSEAPAGTKIFFWSSYYADDAITGIERAISFFGARTGPAPRFERFAACLNQKNQVLVFDGIERMLKETGNDPRFGSALNMDAKQLLMMLRGLQQSRSLNTTVILTSRMIPKELEDAAVVYTPLAMTAADAKDHLVLHDRSWTPYRSALVALLDGHRYALELAALWVGERNALMRGLSQVGPRHRIEKMIELTMENLGADTQPHGGWCHRILSRMAIFMGPLTNEVLKHCYDLAKEESKRSRSAVFPTFKQVKKILLERNLLFEVQFIASKQNKEPCRYAIQPIVREYVFHRVHHADANTMPILSLTGYSSGTAVVDPGIHGWVVLTELFRRIRKAWNAALRALRNSKADATIEVKMAKAVQSLCEGAFGVLRSRTLSNTVSRWGSYSDYIHYLVRMIDVAKETSCELVYKKNGESGLWTYRDPNYRDAAGRTEAEDQQGPLFGDELAWLYNELGLAFHEEGSAIDALSLWEQAYEINRIVDRDPNGGQYIFQSHCNLGAAYVQYGRLRLARDHFMTAKEVNRKLASHGEALRDADHEPRINCYLALVHHLKGDLTRADDEYKNSLEQLETVGNSRAQSIFFRHRSDLKIRLKQYDEAEHLLRSARAKADDAHFPDLVAQVQLTEGHLFRVRKQYQDAIREYSASLEFARRAGVRSLEADIHSEMARLALDLGDNEVARHRAIKSLKIANELHLGLRQTHGLVVLGLATVRAGQKGLGVAYLSLAKRLAEQQQYWLRWREADAELHRIGGQESFEPRNARN